MCNFGDNFTQPTKSLDGWVGEWVSRWVGTWAGGWVGITKCAARTSKQGKSATRRRRKNRKSKIQPKTRKRCFDGTSIIEGNENCSQLSGMLTSIKHSHAPQIARKMSFLLNGIITILSLTLSFLVFVFAKYHKYQI